MCCPQGLSGVPFTNKKHFPHESDWELLGHGDADDRRMSAPSNRDYDVAVRRLHPVRVGQGVRVFSEETHGNPLREGSAQGRGRGALCSVHHGHPRGARGRLEGSRCGVLRGGLRGHSRPPTPFEQPGHAAKFLDVCDWTRTTQTVGANNRESHFV